LWTLISRTPAPDQREGRDTFSLKRDGVVNELRVRGMDEQLEALRRELGEERAG
jgi:hypothetical protein